MEDWGLQAVVGGSTNYENNPIPCFDSWTQIQNEQYPDHDFLFDLPDLLLDSTEAIVGEDLEQLYRPFYPVMDSQIILTSSNIAVPKEGGEKIDDQKQSTSGNVQPTKHKKRKNQEKKEVVQVAEEGLYSDMWAWRKYGQKPIKGSPFPRSYYRCSSEKGCPARKQVEQSFSDPGSFTVTYKAEHSHTQPTRRNSLAGKTRQRFSSTPKVVINSGDPSTAKTQDSESPVLISVLSPATPSISSMEEKRRFQDCDAEIDEFIIPEMILGDDFFVGFEDLNGMAFDIAVDGSNSGHFR